MPFVLECSWNCYPVLKCIIRVIFELQKNTTHSFSTKKNGSGTTKAIKIM